MSPAAATTTRRLFRGNTRQPPSPVSLSHLGKTIRQTSNFLVQAIRDRTLRRVRRLHPGPARPRTGEYPIGVNDAPDPAPPRPDTPPSLKQTSRTTSIDRGPLTYLSEPRDPVEQEAQWRADAEQYLAQAIFPTIDAARLRYTAEIVAYEVRYISDMVSFLSLIVSSF